jgi:hypothetical protein
MGAGLNELRVGQMLPDIRIPAANGGATIPLRSARGETTVIFWRHPFACAGCDQYLQSVAEIADEFGVWDARFLILASTGVSSTMVPFGTVMTETEELPINGAGLIVADRYGQIFYVRHTDDTHELSSPRELMEWLKYLGTLCPE